jgi:hypothetical protein
VGWRSGDTGGRGRSADALRGGEDEMYEMRAEPQVEPAGSVLLWHAVHPERRHAALCGCELALSAPAAEDQEAKERYCEPCMAAVAEAIQTR